METEKLYRIKPELRGYFAECYSDIKRPFDWWRGLTDPSALEEVNEAKITEIAWLYWDTPEQGRSRLSIGIRFNEDYTKKRGELEFVAKSVEGILSAALIGKTWEELAERGEKEVGK